MELLEMMFPEVDKLELHGMLDQGMTINQIIDQIVGMKKSETCQIWDDLQTLVQMFPKKDESILYDKLLLYGMDDAVAILHQESKISMVPSQILLPKDLTAGSKNQPQSKIDHLLQIFPMFDYTGAQAALSKTSNLEEACLLLSYWAEKYTSNPREMHDSDLQTLVDIFPDRSIIVLDKILTTKGSLENAIQFLCADVDKRQFVDYSLIAKGTQPKPPIIKFTVEKSNDNSNIRNLAQDASQSISDDPYVLRREAHELQLKRHAAFHEAANQYAAGGLTGRSAAIYHSSRVFDINKGHELTARIRHLEEKAARLMLQQNNLFNDKYTIDLHGLTYDESKSILMSIIENWNDKEKKGLKVITGAGHHSKNGYSKLFNSLPKFFESQGWTVEREGLGSFYAKPK